AISFVEWSMWFIPIVVAIRFLARQADDHGHDYRGRRVDLSEAERKIELFARKNLRIARSEVLYPAWNILGEHTSLARIYWLEHPSELGARFKHKKVLRLRSTDPERRTFQIDGRERTAYRLVLAHGWCQLEEVSLTAEQLGLPGDRLYPVYVQSHVPARLRQ